MDAKSVHNSPPIPYRFHPHTAQHFRACVCSVSRFRGIYLGRHTSVTSASKEGVHRPMFWGARGPWSVYASRSRAARTLSHSQPELQPTPRGDSVPHLRGQGRSGLIVSFPCPSCRALRPLTSRPALKDSPLPIGRTPRQMPRVRQYCEYGSLRYPGVMSRRGCGRVCLTASPRQARRIQILNFAAPTSCSSRSCTPLPTRHGTASSRSTR